MSKLQIKEMPVKLLNAFSKQKKCSKEIKTYIQTLRRRYRSREYSKTKQEKDNKEILEVEKAKAELEKYSADGTKSYKNEDGKIKPEDEKYILRTLMKNYFDFLALINMSPIKTRTLQSLFSEQFPNTWKFQV